MSMMVSFCSVFFPRGVLDEILNLIESVSEGFPSYSLIKCGEVHKNRNNCTEIIIRGEISSVAKI